MTRYETLNWNDTEQNGAQSLPHPLFLTGPEEKQHLLEVVNPASIHTYLTLLKGGLWEKMVLNI